MAQAASDSPSVFVAPLATDSRWEVGDRARVRIAADDYTLVELRAATIMRTGTVISLHRTPASKGFVMQLDDSLDRIDCLMDENDNVTSVYPGGADYNYVRQTGGDWMAWHKNLGHDPLVVVVDDVAVERI